MGDFKNSVWETVILAFGDILILNLSIVMTFFFRFKSDVYINYLYIFPWVVICALLVFKFYGLYNTKNKKWCEILISSICSIFFIALLCFIPLFLVQRLVIPKVMLLIALIIGIILINLWRYGIYKLQINYKKTKKIIIIGESNEASQFADKLKSVANGRCDITGIICTDLNYDDSIGNYKIIGHIKEVKKFLMQIKPDEVYIFSSSNEKLKTIVPSISLAYPWSVYIVPNLYEILLGQSKLEQIDDIPVLRVVEAVSSKKLQFKRGIDIILSLLVLILLLPIILLLAVLIRIDSNGPVFYKQERITEKNKIFNVIKFRTMMYDAEKTSGPVLAKEGDPRITRVGRILRMTRLDEIPQFINVLKGEMSIIGPRPERPCFVEKFSSEIPEYNCRHNLKAGITGLAQVIGKYSTPAENKLRYDLLYSKSMSPLLDLQILLQTVRVILMKDKTS